MLRNKKLIFMVVVATALVISLSGFGIKLPGGGSIGADADCVSKDKAKRKACLEKKAIEAAVVAISKMAIDYASTRKKPCAGVLADLKKSGKKQPKRSELTTYTIITRPGKSVRRGGKVSVISDIVVVPGTKEKKVAIEEELTIYHYKDKNKKLNSIRKPVNGNKQCGVFTSEFTFKMPDKATQGYYPIGNALYINGKSVKVNKNKLQVVQVMPDGSTRLVALQQ